MKPWLAALIATAGTKWNNFCEKNLVADAPDQVIRNNKFKATSEMENYLIVIYTHYAKNVIQGSWAAQRELKYYGDELRAYGIGQDVLKLYSHLER